MTHDEALRILALTLDELLAGARHRRTSVELRELLVFRDAPVEGPYLGVLDAGENEARAFEREAEALGVAIGALKAQAPKP